MGIIASSSTITTTSIMMGRGRVRHSNDSRKTRRDSTGTKRTQKTKAIITERLVDSDMILEGRKKLTNQRAVISPSESGSSQRNARSSKSRSADVSSTAESPVRDVIFTKLFAALMMTSNLLAGERVFLIDKR
jgi:hypothetical protein